MLTYSFVHEKILQRAEQDFKQAFKLSNALSPDLQYYRLSVLPSLLDKVHMNIKAGYDEFVLYEIGKGHNKKYHATDDEGLPSELEFVDGVYATKSEKNSAPFYYLRKLIDQLGSDLGLKLHYKSISETLDFPITAPFDQSRSALIETSDKVFIGMIGELKQSVRRSFKLPSHCAAFTLDLSGIKNTHKQAAVSYKPLSKYPSISQDISLQVNKNLAYSEVYALASNVATDNAKNSDIVLAPLSIYQAKDDNEHKTISMRIVMTSDERTLRDEDLKLVLDQIATKALEQFDAKHI